MFFRRKVDVIDYLKKNGAKIGERCKILSGTDVFSTEPYLVEIGNDVLISTNVKFYCHDGSVSVLNKIRDEHKDLMGKIIVGSNCFIGHNVTILRGTSIGDNCIVGAGAVVKGNFPSNSVIAGVPAHVICDIDAFYERNKDSFVDVSSLNEKEKKEFLIKKFKKSNN